MIRCLVLAVAALLAAANIATAQYPQRPVKIVVPAAPGGGTDVQARYLAQRLSERLGQQFIIENIGAAGGNVAAATVGRADADGYTLLMIAPATVINASLYVRPGYDALKDFVQVAGWAQSPLLFIANPSLASRNLKELASYAKANPGKLEFGSGQGFINHMVMELFKIEADAKILFVPYRGQAPVLTDVISGQIQLTVDSIASSGQFVESGKVRALAITSAERSPRFRDVPTVAEEGYPKLTGNTWYGLHRARQGAGRRGGEIERRGRRHPARARGRQAHPGAGGRALRGRIGRLHAVLPQRAVQMVRRHRQERHQESGVSIRSLGGDQTGRVTR